MKALFPRQVVACAAYCALHLAAQFSARLFEVSPGISIWYPPAGLALSLLVLLGPRYAPVVLLTNVAGAYAVPGYDHWWAPWLFPAIITANYTAAAWLIRRFLGRQLLPGTATGTLSFASATILAPAGAAALGATLLVLLHYPINDQLLHSVLLWWLGDATGILTIFPVFLVFAAPWLEGKPHPAQRWRWEPGPLALVAAQAAAMLAALWFVFGQKTILPHSTLYVCFLPLIWICLRHGLPGATLATLALVMGCLVGLREFTVGIEPSQLVGYVLFGLAASILGLGLGSAVTRRNDALAELSEGRARFDRVIEGAQLGLWDWHVPSGQIVYNRRCADLLRIDTPQKLTREQWEDAIHPEDRAANRAALERHLAGETPLYEAEYRIHTADGRWRWVHSRGSVVRRTSDHAPEVVSGTHADVTERKLAESAARRLLAIVEASTDFVVTVDAHGQVLYANAAFEELVGPLRSLRLHGQPLINLLPPDAGDLLQADTIPNALAHGTWRGELTLRDARRREIPTSVIAIAHRDTENRSLVLSFVMRDISAQKQAEAANLDKERRILQVQKAESLSVLAGGIAHDFNNLLTAIMGNVSLLKLDSPAVPTEDCPLTQIEIATSRAADLCNSMLAYSGRFHLTPTELDLNQVVTESVELIQAAISKKIRIETQLGADLPAIKGAAGQLQQAIINLALNANDAIGDQPGVIAVRTRRYTDADRDTAPGMEEAPAQHSLQVAVEVEDTGCGVPEELRLRIFEPFFTTKPNGHGLGLAAANGIVRAHGGAITVHNAKLRGAMFRIVLPAIEAPLRSSAGPATSPAALRESGLALIADDEDLVRAVVSRLVERMGFTPICASDGADAVTKFQEHHRSLRFVLTDLSMPKMTGDEAMIEMRRINPTVPVILMSGYPEKMAADHFALASPSALLVKPIRMQVLEKTIQQIIAPEPPQTAGSPNTN